MTPLEPCLDSLRAEDGGKVYYADPYRECLRRQRAKEKQAASEEQATPTENPESVPDNAEVSKTVQENSLVKKPFSRRKTRHNRAADTGKQERTLFHYMRSMSKDQFDSIQNRDKPPVFYQKTPKKKATRRVYTRYND